MLWEGARACLIIFQIRKIMRRHTITVFPQKELYQTSKFSSVCTIPICNKYIYLCPAAPSSVVFIRIRSSIYFMKRRTNIQDSRFQRHLVVAYPYHVIERADNCVMHVRFGSSGVPCDFSLRGLISVTGAGVLGMYAGLHANCGEGQYHWTRPTFCERKSN